jgi:hypothetical protein
MNHLRVSGRRRLGSAPITTFEEWFPGAGGSFHPTCVTASENIPCGGRSGAEHGKNAQIRPKKKSARRREANALIISQPK